MLCKRNIILTVLVAATLIVAIICILIFNTSPNGYKIVFSADDIEIPLTNSDIETTKSVIKTKLLNNNISDYEIFAVEDNSQIVVQFPEITPEDEELSLPNIIRDISTNTGLYFISGYEWSDDESDIVLLGSKDIATASPSFDALTSEPIVNLIFTDSGKEKFATATSQMVGETISIWLVTSTPKLDENGNALLDEKGNPIRETEEILLSAPTVQESITNGECMISGGFSAKEATELAENISAGIPPCTLNICEISSITYDND